MSKDWYANAPTPWIGANKSWFPRIPSGTSWKNGPTCFFLDSFFYARSLISIDSNSIAYQDFIRIESCYLQLTSWWFENTDFVSVFTSPTNHSPSSYGKTWLFFWGLEYQKTPLFLRKMKQTLWKNQGYIPTFSFLFLNSRSVFGNKTLIRRSLGGYDQTTVLWPQKLRNLIIRQLDIRKTLCFAIDFHLRQSTPRNRQGYLPEGWFGETYSTDIGCNRKAKNWIRIGVVKGYQSVSCLWFQVVALVSCFNPPGVSQASRLQPIVLHRFFLKMFYVEPQLAFEWIPLYIKTVGLSFSVSTLDRYWASWNGILAKVDLLSLFSWTLDASSPHQEGSMPSDGSTFRPVDGGMLEIFPWMVKRISKQTAEERVRVLRRYLADRHPEKPHRRGLDQKYCRGWTTFYLARMSRRTKSFHLDENPVKPRNLLWFFYQQLLDAKPKGIKKMVIKTAVENGAHLSSPRLWIPKKRSWTMVYHFSENGVWKKKSILVRVYSFSRQKKRFFHASDSWVGTLGVQYFYCRSVGTRHPKTPLDESTTKMSLPVVWQTRVVFGRRTHRKQTFTMPLRMEGDWRWETRVFFLWMRMEPFGEVGIREKKMRWEANYRCVRREKSVRAIGWETAEANKRTTLLTTDLTLVKTNIRLAWVFSGFFSGQPASFLSFARVAASMLVKRTSCDSHCRRGETQYLPSRQIYTPFVNRKNTGPDPEKSGLIYLAKLIQGSLSWCGAKKKKAWFGGTPFEGSFDRRMFELCLLDGLFVFQHPGIGKLATSMILSFFISWSITCWIGGMALLLKASGLAAFVGIKSAFLPRTTTAKKMIKKLWKQAKDHTEIPSVDLSHCPIYFTRYSASIRFDTSKLRKNTWKRGLHEHRTLPLWYAEHVLPKTSFYRSYWASQTPLFLTKALWRDPSFFKKKKKKKKF